MESGKSLKICVINIPVSCLFNQTTLYITNIMAGFIPTLANISYADLICDLGETAEETIRWCQQHGLIAVRKDWVDCGREMMMVNRDGKDGKVWQCGRPCRNRVSIRHGTFLYKSNLTSEKIVRFNYLWAHELLSVKTAKREFNMSNSTIVDWKSFLRDICTEHFIDNPAQLGGPGMTVEIDESVFTQRKYNRGRMVSEQWVFGGIDTTTKKCFLVPVDRRCCYLVAHCATIYFAWYHHCV